MDLFELYNVSNKIYKNQKDKILRACWNAGKQSLKEAIFRYGPYMSICNFEFILKLVIEHIFNFESEEYDRNRFQKVMLYDEKYPDAIIYIILPKSKVHLISMNRFLYIWEEHPKDVNQQLNHIQSKICGGIRYSLSSPTVSLSILDRTLSPLSSTDADLILDFCYNNIIQNTCILS